MRIENNIKTPETENKSLEIKNTQPLSEEENRSLFVIKEWILNHRLNYRQKLIGNSVDLATVVAFLPLALGFFQFLTDSSRSSSTLGQNDHFFAKNLPVFTQFKPKLSFETFEYISKSNKRAEPTSAKTKATFGSTNYGVSLKKPASIRNTSFNGISCDFYLLTSRSFPSKISSINQLARTLDELPAYLEGFKNLDRGNVVCKNSLFSPTKTITNSSLDSSNQKNLSLKQNKKLLFDYSSKVNTNLTLVPSLKHAIKKTSFSILSLPDNPFYKDCVEFYTEKKQFTTELQKAFTEKSISCFSNDSGVPFSDQTKKKIPDQGFFLNFSLPQNSQLNDDFLSETILQELEKTRISDDLTTFRRMSGYLYPDMTDEELYWFYSGNPLKSTKNIQISVFNPLPVKTKEFNFNVKKLPEISIQTNQVSIQNPELESTFYTGSSVILDSLRALDWKIASKQNFRSWFNTYISPLNPLLQPFENFFGVYNSPKWLADDQNQKLSDFSKTSLFSVKSTSSGYFAGAGFFDALEESVVRFAPSSRSFQFISNSEIEKTSLIRNLEVNFSKNTEAAQLLTIPVLQLQHPGACGSKFSEVGKNSESQTLQNYSSYFTFTNKGNPDYAFSTDSFSQQNFITKYTSGSYTKTASIYSKLKHSTQGNVDHWEPLTSTSWLTITQFSFAFFIFHILKSLADNYGRELLGYLLDLIASLGILDDSLKQEIEILLGQRDKGFRIVLESQKNFKDIVGIQKLLPELYEVVWFLRNSARDFSLSKTLPRGILLTGPPGTGKTLLVQALAGEAQVPVVVLSGSSLIEPGESGALKLEKVFQEARELAPCIVFIDEIDTLAQKRMGVVQNPMGPDELVESLTSFEKSPNESPFEQLQIAREKQESDQEGDTSIQTSSQEQQLSLLTQFLIELDGIQGRDGVIVIGATNRPEVLDPAVLRPGRLEKILQIGLPGHQKRIDILQFYGQGLGYENSIPWNYLGDRTAGFTAADLATLMNESTIKAILSESKHTIETIEHGIDRLTTSESEKFSLTRQKTDSNMTSLRVASKMNILRLAYYQAGKIVLSTFLETHPKSVVASLWPRRPTIRSAQIATNLQNSLFDFARLCEITDRLIGCYGGKAAEILFVQQFSSSKYAQLSTLGFEDLLFGQKLVYCILEKSSFYSKKSQIQQTAYLAPNINTREFREIPEKLDLYTGVVESIQRPPMSKALETQTSSLGSKKKSGLINRNAQMYYSIPWWQQQISSELEFVEKNFTNWSRLYLSNPDQSDRNPEWLPPDEFYHNGSGLKNVKKAFANLQKSKSSSPTIPKKADTFNTNLKNKTSSLKSPFKDKDLTLQAKKEIFLPEKADFSWNEIAVLTRDYPGHSLVLQSFNRALVILNKNRELLDRLVVELLYKEILRQPDIEELVKEFNSISPLSKQKCFVNETETQLEVFNLENQKKEKLTILESSWGSHSRKPTPRWINFAEFSKETT
uniref:Cell division protein ftsH n=1 Tax=Micractinium sp. LBA 32 TaxID=1759591 RepID=A0A4Y6A5N2_9CHLO|nr:cell division protein ftsH [Micractinium sp. LBA 32]